MVIFKRSFTRSGPYEIVDCTYLQFTKFSGCGKKHTSINFVNILFFNLQYMYHKGDYSSEILLCFFS